MCLGISACALTSDIEKPAETMPDPDVVRPKPRPASLAPPPPQNATTVEQFDTTTGAEREAATEVAADTGGETLLGQSIVTLGAPAKPGFWLETPLVSTPRPGRVVATATGESVLVDLIPIDGPDGAGSRISLAALRLLGVGLAGLHEMQVYGR